MTVSKEVSKYMAKLARASNKKRTKEFYSAMSKARWDKKKKDIPTTPLANARGEE